MTSLPLRLRVFLFFALLAGGGLGLVGAALWSVRGSADQAALLRVAVISGLGFLALNTAVWLLFDEHVARPIERLAIALRARTHAGFDLPLAPGEARFLGDLAPATRAATDALAERSDAVTPPADDQTERLVADREQLAEVIAHLPLAAVLCDEAGRVVLYNEPARKAVSALRLGGVLADVFEADAVRASLMQSAKTGRSHLVELRLAESGQSIETRLDPLPGDTVLVTFSPVSQDICEPARLTYDFRLPAKTGFDTALRDLAVTVLDTETTGLLPHQDDIVQIGAVRILAGRFVEGEQIDQVVDPGRLIPPASSRIHRVTDAMVSGAPRIAEAGRQLHRFAKGTVIVAHNAPFDMAFLHRQAADSGLRWDHPVIDTVLVSAVVFGQTEDHSLDALCARLLVKLRPELRHTALGDARATAECFLRMMPMLEARGIRTLADLIAHTRRQGRLLEDLN